MSKGHSFIGKKAIKKILKNGSGEIHFFGVGGVGMYSLFKLSERMGESVSGSDDKEGALFIRLKESQKNVYLGFNEEKLSRVKLGVYTLALDENDKGLKYLDLQNICSVSRAEYLGALMEDYKYRLGVSGSHGKSTSTAMLDAIFSLAGKNPTTLCGAEMECGDPCRLGGKEFFIYEACEYKDSFLHFSPTHSLFLNLEHDHVDYFETLESIKKSFLEAIKHSPVSIINIDDENLASLIEKNEIKEKIHTFAIDKDAEYTARDISERRGRYSFTAFRRGERLLSVDLKVPGRFNVLNALGVIAMAIECGIKEDVISRALSDFCGIGRRIELVSKYKGSPVYYDYAHHPTEIKAVIGAVREMENKPITVIFKPHTFSRTKGLFSEFCDALSKADKLLLFEIEGIREKNNDSVSSAMLCERIGKKAKLISEESLEENLSGGASCAIILMGAADNGKALKMLLSDRENKFV